MAISQRYVVSERKGNCIVYVLTVVALYWLLANGGAKLAACWSLMLAHTNREVTYVNLCIDNSSKICTISQVFIWVTIHNGCRGVVWVFGCCIHDENDRSRLSRGVGVLCCINVVKCHHHKIIVLAILGFGLLYWISELLELVRLVANVNLLPANCHDGLLPAFAAS